MIRKYIVRFYFVFFWKVEGGIILFGGSMFLFFFFIRVVVDGDDVDCGIRGVGNDNRLSLSFFGGVGGFVVLFVRDRGVVGRVVVY